MKCYHILSDHSDHVKKWICEHHAVPLPSGNQLLFHNDRELDCPDPATCIGHPWDDAPVSAAVAAELATFGVVSTDTVRIVVLKVMKVHRHFKPD